MGHLRRGDAACRFNPLLQWGLESLWRVHGKVQNSNINVESTASRSQELDMDGKMAQWVNKMLRSKNDLTASSHSTAAAHCEIIAGSREQACFAPSTPQTVSLQARSYQN